MWQTIFSIVKQAERGEFNDKPAGDLVCIRGKKLPISQLKDDAASAFLALID